MPFASSRAHFQLPMQLVVGMKAMQNHMEEKHQDQHGAESTYDGSPGRKIE